MPNTDRLLTKPFVLCFANNFLQGVAYSLFLHVPGFYASLGASPAVIGWMFAAMSAVAIGIRPILGTVMDRYGRRGPILLGNALNVVAIGLYLTVDQVGAWAVIVRVVHGVSAAILLRGGLGAPASADRRSGDLWDLGDAAHVGGGHPG